MASNKRETGKEYVDDTKHFYDVTALYCSILPRKWERTVLQPMIDAADAAEKDVVIANRKAYINPNDNVDAQIKGYETRIEYLSDALARLDVFDVCFERMMRQIDIAKHEKQRMKRAIQKIVHEERLNNKGVSISVHFDEDSISFMTKTSEKSVQTKLSTSKISIWMDAEAKAKNSITKRMSDDRKQLKAIREKKERQA